MVRVLNVSNPRIPIISLTRNDVFYSGGLVPDQIGDLVKMKRIKSGEIRMIAKKDLILVVEELWHDPCTGAKNILFMRDDRADEKAGSLWVAGIHHQPELRRILENANVQRVESVGGFDRVLIYGDEIAVPETYNNGKFRWWIIKKVDVEKYINEASPEHKQSELGKFLIWHEVHIDKNGKKFPVVRVEGWGEPFDFDDVTHWKLTEFTVFFDKESRIVLGIFLRNKFVAEIPYTGSPIRGVEVGKRLPPGLGRDK